MFIYLCSYHIDLRVFFCLLMAVSVFDTSYVLNIPIVSDSWCYSSLPFYRKVLAFISLRQHFLSIIMSLRSITKSPSIEVVWLIIHALSNHKKGGRHYTGNEIFERDSWFNMVTARVRTFAKLAYLCIIYTFFRQHCKNYKLSFIVCV